MSSKVILITGASGFLGTWLSKEAVKSGFKIYGIDLRVPMDPKIWEGFATSSLDTVDFDQLLKGCDLDAVFHLAGGASVAASVSNPYSDFASLVPGTVRLAMFMKQYYNKTRLYLFSSAAVYGNPERLPINESAEIKPISPYGIHKATTESLLKNYSRIFDLHITIFRIFSVYGPELRKQLIWDVCQRALDAEMNGIKEIKLYGTGKESRDFIYVKDLCRAVIQVLNGPTENKIETYNISSGIESSISEIADYLIKHLDIDIQISFDGVVRPGDPTNWKADVDKLRVLGFEPQYDLNEGLKQVATWARAVY